MKQSYYYKDGKVEIIDIINDKEIIIKREYQDNIYEILSLENELEELNNYKNILLNNMNNHKKWLKNDIRDWKILISLDLIVSITVFIVSLISNYNDLLFLGLEGIVLSSNIPAFISSSRYKKKMKKDTVINSLELSNINNLINTNIVNLNKLNSKITKDNEEKIKETNNYIYINNSNQELIKYLEECKKYFINENNKYNYTCDINKDNVSVVKTKKKVGSSNERKL